jgi:glutamine synthetase adenylyltransferase
MQDYYAEMLKTDEHMAFVKERLIVENKKIEAAERARKQRDNKKFGKKVQQDVLAKRQEAKKVPCAVFQCNTRRYSYTLPSTSHLCQTTHRR